MEFSGTDKSVPFQNCGFDWIAPRVEKAHKPCANFIASRAVSASQALTRNWRLRCSELTREKAVPEALEVSARGFAFALLFGRFLLSGNWLGAWRSLFGIEF